MNNLLFILYFVIFICFWILFNQYAKDFKNGFNEYFQIDEKNNLDFSKYRKEINRGKNNIKLANINNVYDIKQQDLMSHFFDKNNTKETHNLNPNNLIKINTPSCLDDYFSTSKNESPLANFF